MDARRSGIPSAMLCGKRRHNGKERDTYFRPLLVRFRFYDNDSRVVRARFSSDIVTTDVFLSTSCRSNVTDNCKRHVLYWYVGNYYVYTEQSHTYLSHYNRKRHCWSVEECSARFDYSSTMDKNRTCILRTFLNSAGHNNSFSCRHLVYNRFMHYSRIIGAGLSKLF